MRIKTFGAKHFTGQLPRIELGFKELGHEIVEENPDLVYCNNFPYDDAIKEDAPFKIFTLLDVPVHCWVESDYAKCNQQLRQANAVCAISETVRAQIKGFFKFDSKTIYQPVMPVYQTNEKKYHGFKYLIVGRVNDPNKRTKLFFDYLRKYDPEAFVTVLGSEDPGFGTYLGVVSNEELNFWYNSVDYVFCLTRYGGIELSPIESILTGTFPIVANDSECAMEFNSEFACDPTSEGIHEKILEIEANSSKYKEIVARKQPVFKEWFSPLSVAKKIMELVE
jgi:glycosyltransferase involved in cell wall biosynthesis